ncbi:hypothetical protein CONLIGDRAFT_693856 [Coniochaeta ligniaria NRRL 30616]|uniref:Uncharacterized protein n=1 Tax=Coniochaeta ligniaria NRRL 30616 TaxID=1408157 RepID=A0A1J7I6X2_9PEZI|nr:hypothetical protein CONLIGDRAFT_693856 [Coniochaeta ligniaria NRRL 30616]
MSKINATMEMEASDQATLTRGTVPLGQQSRGLHRSETLILSSDSDSDTEPADNSRRLSSSVLRICKRYGLGRDHDTGCFTATDSPRVASDKLSSLSGGRTVHPNDDMVISSNFGSDPANTGSPNGSTVNTSKTDTLPAASSIASVASMPSVLGAEWLQIPGSPETYVFSCNWDTDSEMSDTDIEFEDVIIPTSTGERLVTTVAGARILSPDCITPPTMRNSGAAGHDSRDNITSNPASETEALGNSQITTTRKDTKTAEPGIPPHSPLTQDSFGATTYPGYPAVFSSDFPTTTKPDYSPSSMALPVWLNPPRFPALDSPSLPPKPKSASSPARLPSQVIRRGAETLAHNPHTGFIPMSTYNSAMHPPTPRPSSPYPTVPTTTPSAHQPHRVALSRSGDIWDVPSSPSDSDSDKPSMPHGSAQPPYRQHTTTSRPPLPRHTVTVTNVGAKPSRKRKHDSDNEGELDPNDDRLLEAEQAFMTHLRKKAKTGEDGQGSGGVVVATAQTGDVAKRKAKALPRYRQRGQRVARRNAVVSVMQHQDMEAGHAGVIRCGKGKDVDCDGDEGMD